MDASPTITANWSSPPSISGGDAVPPLHYRLQRWTLLCQPPLLRPPQRGRGTTNFAPRPIRPDVARHKKHNGFAGLRGFFFQRVIKLAKMPLSRYNSQPHALRSRSSASNRYTRNASDTSMLNRKECSACLGNAWEDGL
ncbi:hypothetical protein CORC01_05095 [Colletotrichum orchidophilum]|uniref:Uncharacterized protein n=1 Tax=Colletotrichum orchidophilum TaxID=1209926 RepID=A0A1G4BDQ8_9PEZI|nr:uncharacterized protein CORC01_05095 [Colletotrichum orchidophilum]OHE99517.1 hypothetical protein CORC01_05095 [Colletotrichum orchidophilum]